MNTRVEPLEEIIEPDRPIIDPHHHLRDRPGDHYMFEDLRQDLGSGHRIIATVAIECGDMHRATGPQALRPVGETEFLAGVAAMFDSGKYGPVAGVAGIVAYADLTLGTGLQAVLDAHRAASGGRLRGIRNPVAWHEHAEFRVTRTGPAGILHDPRFRGGVAVLGNNGLCLDAWVYHPQLPDLLDVARACPQTTIVLNHLGGPLGAGPYRTQREQVYAEWRASLRELAGCPNVVCKLGGLGMPVIGLGFNTAAQRPTSPVLADAFRPYIETAIDIFGADRCMFESNFPPDGVSNGCAVMWNAFKRIVRDYGEAEKTALFLGTAASVYRLRDLPGQTQKESQQ
ncbi:MAG TPA: amidohydrolase family protein [Bordetella sp.]|nr:amidohydrolase family protein [Bordetella sp.]